MLESGETRIQTQACESKVGAPNFYGFPGCCEETSCSVPLTFG